MIKLNLAHMDTYATKHNFNSKQPQMKDMLTSWRFHQGNQHHGERQIYRTNYVKATSNTQGKSTCFNKTTKWKNASKMNLKNKGEQEKNNHKYYQRN